MGIIVLSESCKLSSVLYKLQTNHRHKFSWGQLLFLRRICDIWQKFHMVNYHKDFCLLFHPHYHSGLWKLVLELSVGLMLSFWKISSFFISVVVFKDCGRLRVGWCHQQFKVLYHNRKQKTIIFQNELNFVWCFKITKKENKFIELSLSLILSFKNNQNNLHQKIALLC